MYSPGIKKCLLFIFSSLSNISVKEHARVVHLFVLQFIWISTVYLSKLFHSATVPLCDTIVLSRARHIRLTFIDVSK